MEKQNTETERKRKTKTRIKTQQRQSSCSRYHHHQQPKQPARTGTLVPEELRARQGKVVRRRGGGEAKEEKDEGGFTRPFPSKPLSVYRSEPTSNERTGRFYNGGKCASTSDPSGRCCITTAVG